MTSATKTRAVSKIDHLMEEASQALVATRYFESERKSIEALRAAHAARDYDRMARILLPLQEARRQKRMLAVDSGKIFTLDRKQEPGELRLQPGCWLVTPPLVGADGRDLRARADEAEVPVLVVVREPTTRAGLWPVVMIGPVTVRAKVEPVKKLTPRWFLEASEALGDEAIAEVAMDLSPGVRVDRLMDRLEVCPEHEKLHQALEEACRAAEHDAATERAAGEKPGARKRRAARDEDGE